MTNNLPEPDDAPWLNLTPQEVEELRYNKQKLTDYGKHEEVFSWTEDKTHEKVQALKLCGG